MTLKIKNRLFNISTQLKDISVPYLCSVRELNFGLGYLISVFFSQCHEMSVYVQTISFLSVRKLDAIWKVNSSELPVLKIVIYVKGRSAGRGYYTKITLTSICRLKLRNKLRSNDQRI